MRSVALVMVGLALLACGPALESESTAASGGSGGAGANAGGMGEGGVGEGGNGAASNVVCHAPSSPEAFEIGTGEACFERLADGDSILQMNGPQGGYHLWLAVGCTDCGGEVELRYSMLDPATLEPIERTFPDSQTIANLATIEGWPQAAGIQMGMPGTEWDPEADPPLPEGTEMVLQVSALDATTEELIHQASVSVILGAIVPWDPCVLHPEGPCCQELCD